MALILDFPPTNRQQWLDKLSQELKGQNPSTLDWEYSPQLTVSPLITSEDLRQQHTPLIDSAQSWEIIEPIVLTDNLTSINALILNCLNGGATALSIDTNGHKLSNHDVQILFDGVYIEMIKLYWKDQNVECLWNNLSVFSHIFEAEHHSTVFDNHDNSQYGIGIGSGQDTDRFQSVAQQLHECIDIMDNISTKASFCLEIPLDDHYFINIALLRAVRICWHTISTEYPDRSFELFLKGHVNPSIWHDDINYNRIKISSIAASSISGGINGVELYSNKLNDPDEHEYFSRRIARNINHLLIEESHLRQVNDPAAGSYYIENLTDRIASLIWNHFTSLFSSHG